MLNKTKKAIVAATCLSALCVSSLQAQTQARAQNQGEINFPATDNAAKALVKASGGYTHELSQFSCPASVGELKLSERQQYSYQGDHIGCIYDNGSDLRMNVYVQRAPRSMTSETMVSATKKNLAASVSSLSERYSRPATLKIGGKTVQCHSGGFDVKVKANSGVRKDDMTICEAGPWSINFSQRATAKSIKRMPALVKQLAAAQSMMNDHDRLCGERMTEISDMPVSNLSGLNIAADRMGYEETGPACYLGVTSSKADGLVMLMWPKNPDTPYTLHKIGSDLERDSNPFYRVQDMWAGVAAADRKSEPGYILIKETDAIREVYSGFKKIPNPGDVVGEMQKAEKGEITPRLSTQKNSEGGANISIG